MLRRVRFGGITFAEDFLAPMKDNEGEQLHLYDLAKGELNPDIKDSLYNVFPDVFAPPYAS